MENNRDLKHRKKALKSLLYILIGIGALSILYLAFISFTTSEWGTAILYEWRETYFKKVEVEEDYEITDKKETEKIIESSKDFDKDEEVSSGEELDYKSLTADDFFPLKIIIPRIEVESIVNEGYDYETLKNGPGYITVTPLPGDKGRCTISGHRTIYDAPFKRVDELENGDLIYLETINNELLTYIVTGMEIVRATDVWILEGTDKRELLLTTCHPKYSAAKRLIIIAELLEVFSFEIDQSL